MDSITQIALGAAVGEATLGRHVGKKAMLWGGICGLLPDLDLLIPLGDAVKQFTYHRSASHSLFVLAGLTPLFVALILKLNPETAVYRFRWYALVFLAFSTHVLLDCLTVYGTQIFWPLGTPPVMWSTIFIVDPVYSVPLILGVLAALVLSRKTSRGHVINTVGLALSIIYLMWSVGAKVYVNDAVRESLRRQHVGDHAYLTIPTPFNTLLWRVLVMEDDGYYEGFYSIFDKTRNIKFTRYPSDRQLLESLENSLPVKRLQWFTHGFYSVRQVSEDIVITDLRMGLEPDYVFRFKVGTVENARVKPVNSGRIHGKRGLDQLGWVWRRIWTHCP